MNSSSETLLMQAVNTLAPRLRSLDIESAPVSDYTKRYYRDYLRKLDYALKSIVQLLTIGADQTKKSIHEISVIDHGGGIGIISFLAAEAGFQKVIYSDIFGPAAKDASVLADMLGVKVTDFHTGNIKELADHLKKKGQSADLLVSRNVIEHIYDLSGFMNELALIPTNSKISVAFSTTANQQNPLTVWYTERIQKKAENVGLKGKWEKETDRGTAFIEVRKNIIRENFAQLKNEEIELLAKRTRGFIEEDIIRLTSLYTVNGDLPEPVSGQNTCDPLTGNRTEHLLPVKIYESLFRKYHFTFIVRPGYYNTAYSSGILNMITPLANRMISMNKNLGIKLAPFIILAGTKAR